MLKSGTWPLPAVFVAVSLSFLALSCKSVQQRSGIKEEWNQDNSPEIFGVKTTQYDKIPKKARLPDEQMPWSDHYWPTLKGGVSDRWLSKGKLTTWADWLKSYKSQKYDPLKDDEASKLSDEQIAQLSPAEKYDLLVGSNFLLTKAEQENSIRTEKSNKGIPWWFGLCHGWSIAAIMEKQPGPVALVEGVDGRKIPFYSSDIKALMTYVYANGYFPSKFLGSRCENDKVTFDKFGRIMDQECRDVNPGALHLILWDYIANRKESFVADLGTKDTVWNQPVVGYEFEYLNKRPVSASKDRSVHAPNTETLIDVTLALEYVKETNPYKEPIKAATTYQRMRYTLELDKEGNIIGGEWSPGSNSHPDFLWTASDKPESPGLAQYENVKKLLEVSLGASADGFKWIPTTTEVAFYKLTFSQKSCAKKSSTLYGLGGEIDDCKYSWTVSYSQKDSGEYQSLSASSGEEVNSFSSNIIVPSKAKTLKVNLNLLKDGHETEVSKSIEIDLTKPAQEEYEIEGQGQAYSGKISVAKF